MSLPTENLDEATDAEHADHHVALHTLANDVVNVRSPEYGAKGDNVTNDTDAVLAAQAVAYAGRKPLWFPAGTYILDHSTFVLQGEEVWVGDGIRGSRLKFSGLTSGDEFGVQLGPTGVGSNAPELRHLHVLSGDAGTEGRGVFVKDAYRFRCTNVQVLGFHEAWTFEGSWIGVLTDIGAYNSDIGILVATNGNGLNFVGATVEANVTGVLVQGGVNVNFWGGTIEGQSSQGVVIDGSGARILNVALRGVYFEINTVRDVHVNDAAAENTLIEHCSFAPNGTSSIVVAAGDRTVIRDNTWVIGAGASTAVAIDITGGTNAEVGPQSYGATKITPFDPAAHDSGTGTLIMTSDMIRGVALVGSGSGATGSRPTNRATGDRWFDTTLGHPIWWGGTNWVNATGTTV